MTSELIVSTSITIGQLALDGDQLFWLEHRPGEGGRQAIVRRDADGAHRTLTPRSFNVRTRVHEYGGGAYCVADGVVYFSNFTDQRLYRQRGDAPPTPLTAAASMCYADMIKDSAHNRLICIREDRTHAGREPLNAIVGIALDAGARTGDGGVAGVDDATSDGDVASLDDATSGGDVAGVGDVLVSGNDFYASPRLRPDGRQLAWLTWNHPNMPWDGTELWVADVRTDGTLHAPRHVAGGVDVSVFQPEWSPDGRLHYVSDQSGWWNLYRLDDETAVPLYPMAAEFGAPQWTCGQRLYGFESSRHLICAWTQNGVWHLGRLDTAQHMLERFDLPRATVTVGDMRVRGAQVFCTVGATDRAAALAHIDAHSHAMTIVRRAVDGAEEDAVDAEYLSAPTAITYPTLDGATGHGFYYPPRNAAYQGPPSARPPLLVKVHGGPTGACTPALNLMIQYWTSRGFAVLDVNYGGSTGYGRAYRERLNGQWGVVDVDDCVSAVASLVDSDAVDPTRVTITGGSAGGFTALCAVTFRERFTAAASYYGVSDLHALARETHKFESRYLTRLIGPLPERADLYAQRSPIHFTDRLSCPLILFQGLDDPVVPPNQAENMFNAVKAKGIAVAYIAFEGEQHGFRQAKHIKQVLDNELAFYAIVFGFTPADPVPPIPIANADTWPPRRRGGGY